MEDGDTPCETRESHDANHTTLDRGRHQRFERTPGGHDRVRVPVEPDTILYARASSASQLSSLDTEERFPRARYPDGRVVRDTGSGVVFRRRGLVARLERALRGEAVHVVAATPDRITRSGYPLVRHVVERSGGGIELLEEDDLTEQFDVRCLFPEPSPKVAQTSNTTYRGVSSYVFGRYRSALSLLSCAADVAGARERVMAYVPRSGLEPGSGVAETPVMSMVIVSCCPAYAMGFT